MYETKNKLSQPARVGGQASIRSWNTVRCNIDENASFFFKTITFAGSFEMYPFGTISDASFTV